MHYLLILLGLICSGASLRAAEPSSEGQPLRGSVVGIYLSAKAFTFDDNYQMLLTQFVSQADPDTLGPDQLKPRTLVALGKLFSAQLAEAVGADSVYFLNENPEAAQAFLDAYAPEEHKLRPPGAAMGETDYVMVINPFVLGSYKTTQMYSHSNRILTEQVIRRTARLRFEVWDVVQGQQRFVSEVCLDENEKVRPEVTFDFMNKESPTGAFLARVFGLGMEQLNHGTSSNCER